MHRSGAEGRSVGGLTKRGTRTQRRFQPRVKRNITDTR
jgi:hypothetical protein